MRRVHVPPACFALKVFPVTRLLVWWRGDFQEPGFLRSGKCWATLMGQWELCFLLEVILSALKTTCSSLLCSVLWEARAGENACVTAKSGQLWTSRFSLVVREGWHHVSTKCLCDLEICRERGLNQSPASA